MATPDINKILKASPVSSKYGAPMGAASYFNHPEELLYVQRIKMVDGDYTPAGAYFGGPPSEPLWCGFSAEGGNRVYVRAKTRNGAIKAIFDSYPEARIRQPFGSVMSLGGKAPSHLDTISPSNQTT